MANSYTCPRVKLKGRGIERGIESSRETERENERGIERETEREDGEGLERETGSLREIERGLEREIERGFERENERGIENGIHNETVEDMEKETRQLVLFTQVCTGLPCFVHDRYLSKVDLNIIGDMAVTNIDSSNVNLEWHVDSEVAWCPVLNHTYLRNLQGTCTILPRVNQGACTRSYCMLV